MPGDLSKFSNIKSFPKGSVIVQGGEAAPRELILLLQGNIGVYRNYGLNNEVQVHVLGQGSFYGEFALFLGREQSETLLALSDVILLGVNRKNLAEFLTGQPDMAFTIVEGICKKLDAAQAELEKLQRGSGAQAASRRSSFFPEEHGSYTLPLDNANDYFLYLGKHDCPVCGHSFEQLDYIVSRLQTERVDSDLRVHYKDFEPLYYDVLTCPNCYFSALRESFETASKTAGDLVNREIGPYKLELDIKAGAARDTFTVFAGYYLAMLCAPVVFDNHQLVTATLWLKLSQIYRDCGDEAMVRYASEKAREDFLYAYQNLRISEKVSQRVCYVLGDLTLSLGDVDAARNYFYMAKTNKAGTNVIRRQADQRLEEIREIKQAEKESAPGPV